MVAPSAERLLRIGLGVLAAVVVTWVAVRIFRGHGGPYSVEAATLSGWTLVTGEPGGPAVIGLTPPQALPASLFRQLLQRTEQPLVAPARPLLPLVLRDEYAESLQGVYSIEDLMAVAKDVNIEAARFEPVCLVRRTESTSAGARELFVVLFESPVFDEFRHQLPPLFPEHAGVAMFEPSALHPMLSVGGTDPDFGRWWPLQIDADEECQARFDVE
jgi:hypothetical protein